MTNRHRETISIILDLEESISYYYPSFSRERKNTKECMLKGLHCISPIWDDEGKVKWKEKNNIPIINKDDGIVSVPCSELRELGTRQNTFNKLLLKYPLLCLVDDSYNHKLEKSRCYVLTEMYSKVMAHYVQQSSPRTYVMIRGFGGDMFVNSSEVNKNTLKKKTTDDLTVANISAEKVKQLLQNINGLSSVNRTRLSHLYGISHSLGGVRQEYHRNRTGRLTVKGIANLQNIPKSIRELIFEGHYEVDMVACQWKIAAHYTDDPIIHYYADNSQEFRKKVSGDVGMPLSFDSQMKAVLIAILFGAKRDGSEGPVKDGLGEWSEVFMEHPSVKALVMAVNNLVDKMKKEGYLQKWKEVAENKGWRQLLSYHLQNKESLIMDECRKYLVNPDLLVYDGVITKRDVDIEDLQRHILEKTGFDMKFSKKKLGESK